MKPYLGTNDTVCQQFKTNPKEGLSLAQAKERLITYGPNEITTQKSSSLVLVFLQQYYDPLTILLFVCAGIIYLLGQAHDASIIIGILIFNGILGTIQEFRSEHMLYNLHHYLKTETIVMRAGNEQVISSTFLVPGDIIIIKAGDKIPADARIISCSLLTVDESMLTGETQPVGKTEIPLLKTHAHLHDQNNMLFYGTYALSGHATALVTATGNATQAGQMNKYQRPLTSSIPLQQDLLRLTSWILAAVVIICGSLSILGLIMHTPLADLFSLVTALFICIVPESLPMIMSLVMITGAYKMAQHNVLIKKLKIMQDLGRVDVIITDKTGTLTNNEMMVNQLYLNQKHLKVLGHGYFVSGSIQDQEKHALALNEIAIACSLLNDSKIEFNAALNLFKIKGDPTQAAIAVLAKKINPEIDHLTQAHEVLYHIPFDSHARYQAIFTTYEQEHTAYILGAPEVILAWCNNSTPDITTALETYLSSNHRVLALAKKSYCPTDEKNYQYHSNLVEHDIEFMTLLCMQDTLRPHVPAFITQAQQAGIKIIMATGDHELTALAIAQQSGITTNNLVLTGQEFETLDDQQAIQALKQTTVCARFSPFNKARLIELFHQQHKIVAMTGDGINDAPALMLADIGIAMGNIGTEVTKQAADVILLKDSFAHIMTAIKQGRHVFYNLRRTFLFFLASNMAEVLIIFFALACAFQTPLLPGQILIVNLLVDGLLDAALAMEPISDEPLIPLQDDVAQTIFDTTLLKKMFFFALPMSLISFILFIFYTHSTNITYARSVTMVAMVMFQVYNAFNCRSEKKSLLTLGFTSNHWLILSCVSVIAIQLSLLYIPACAHFIYTTPLRLTDLLIATLLPSCIIVIEEIRKKIARS